MTSRLRSYLYKDVFQKDLPPTVSAPGPAGTAGGLQAASSNNPTPAREGHSGGDPPATYQNVQSASTPQPSKVHFFLLSVYLSTHLLLKKLDKHLTKFNLGSHFL